MEKTPLFLKTRFHKLKIGKAGDPKKRKEITEKINRGKKQKCK